MNSYDYLMGNLQEALKKQIPLMKSRVRKRKIKELHEKYKNSSTIYKINTENSCIYRSYKYYTKET
jgi:hypothetical protein